MVTCPLPLNFSAGWAALSLSVEIAVRFRGENLGKFPGATCPVPDKYIWLNFCGLIHSERRFSFGLLIAQRPRLVTNEGKERYGCRTDCDYGCPTADLFAFPG